MRARRGALRRAPARLRGLMYDSPHKSLVSLLAQLSELLLKVLYLLVLLGQETGQLLDLGLELIRVTTCRRRAHAFLDEVDGVLRLLRALIQVH